MKTPRLLPVVAAAFALVLAAHLSAATPPRKVVFTTPGPGYARLSESDIAQLRAAVPSLELVFAQRETLLAELADADGVIGPITPEQVRAAKQLRWIQVTSAGVERYMFPEIKDSAITLTNMKIVQGPELADHALALLLAHTRRIDAAVRNTTTRTWRGADFTRLMELNGKTAVVVGVGGAGTGIAVRAKAFGMHVIGVDVRDLPLMPFLDESIRPDRLDTVLPRADVLFIAVPHTPETENMIGPRQFEYLRKGAIFICVSRGKIYDNDALDRALRSGHLAAAGVDVTAVEPLPPEHPLWTAPNIIITPHIAGRSDAEGPRYFHVYRENLIRFANGEPLLHVVDKAKGF